MTSDLRTHVTASLTRAETYLQRGPGLSAGLFRPEGASCVIVYSDALLDGVLAGNAAEVLDIGCTVPCRVHVLRDASGCRLGIVRGRPGAPMAAVLLEELVALGFREFLVTGPAGHPALDRGSIAPGDIVLIDRARVLEGTSSHYRPGRSWSRPDAALTDRFGRLLGINGVGYRRGAAASTDAFYRETPELVRSLVRDRILTLDMELSALFTVAAHHSVPIAAAVYVTDIVSVRRGWQAAFHEEGVGAAERSLGRCLRVFTSAHDEVRRCS